MVFSSFQFILLFLPVFLAGMFLVRTCGGRSALLGWIVAGSFVFYASWNPWNLLILCFAASATFSIGTVIARRREDPLRRVWLTFEILLNVGLLAWFKYRHFLVGDPTPLILPLGISFIVFQKIAWLVDVNTGKARPDSPLEFIFFVTFFPQIIAGPIVHYRDIIPQTRLPEWLRFDSRMFAQGVFLFALGLSKKVLIADRIAPAVNLLYAQAAQGHDPGFWEAWAAGFGFGLQLYFDFSGYADMAIGLGALAGLKLPVNFRSPYRALSIVDFWRRWHVTLSTWLRDYVFIPLGGSRVPAPRHLANIGITMLIGGLWHGAAWTFVIWGALHGLLLTGAHAWRLLGGFRIPAALSWAATLTGCMALWIFFKAPDFATALRLTHGLTRLPDGAPAGLDLWLLVDSALLGRPLGLCLWIPGLVGLTLLPWNSQSLSGLGDRQDRALSIPDWVRGAVASLLLLSCLLTMIQQPTTEFLYFAF